MKRLFIPLTSEAFYWFRDNGKTYELRAYGRTWTEKNVYTGREAELRRGYSTGDKINGKVGRVIIGEINRIFKDIHFKKIIPIADSEKDAIERVDNILKGRKEKYIAFEIIR